MVFINRTLKYKKMVVILNYGGGSGWVRLYFCTSLLVGLGIKTVSLIGPAK